MGLKQQIEILQEWACEKVKKIVMIANIAFVMMLMVQFVFFME